MDLWRKNGKASPRLIMERRKFLEQSLWTLPALSMLPALLSACKDTSLTDAPKFKGKVAVIGAGISGLYAAYLLQEMGAQVTVYEATGVHGGRIRSYTEFSDFPMEEGAERIVGNKSSWYDAVKSTGASLASVTAPEYYFVNGAWISSSQAEQDAGYQKAKEILQSIQGYEGGDTDAEVFGSVSGNSDAWKHVLDAWTGTYHGTTANRIGILDIQEQNALWSAGHEEFIIRDRSHLEVIEAKFASIINSIQYNTPITNVNYSDSNIVLTALNGETFNTQRVIVTVPVTMLMQSGITFTPILPTLHRQSIGKIGMDPGIKVHLQFSTIFWPQDAGRMIMPGLMPVFWPAGSGRSAENNVLAGVAFGNQAVALNDLGTDLLPTILAQLDACFGEGVASGSLINSRITDWGAEPWYRGAISFPKLYTTDARGILAEPVANRVFFAGEATHPKGHFGTVHGAMETGLRAAKEVLLS
jgi:monoamine oxidase